MGNSRAARGCMRAVNATSLPNKHSGKIGAGASGLDGGGPMVEQLDPLVTSPVMSPTLLSVVTMKFND